MSNDLEIFNSNDYYIRLTEYHEIYIYSKFRKKHDYIFKNSYVLDKNFSDCFMFLINLGFIENKKSTYGIIKSNFNFEIDFNKNLICWYNDYKSLIKSIDNNFENNKRIKDFLIEYNKLLKQN